MIFDEMCKGGGLGLAKGIKSLVNVTSLSLSIWKNNNISQKGAAELGRSLQHLVKL